ncbi:magnesium/cobalt transporter CorA [Aestuariimicrobium ganziense]|uniref:magnesium/cobalt transporter CorA n=1 Tax=Aestuariimicrobium ganziense TaxID=2773677 RepID=UPI0019456E8F|nr:magnesium/cobalt transporter CorA [Aestuariimicrobium ganziense]
MAEEVARPAQRAPDSVVAWGWYLDGVRQPVHTLKVAVERAHAGEGFVWLGLKDPTDEDMAGFARRFDLHPLAIEDAVEGHTRSKLEQFHPTLFAVLSTVAYVEHETLTEFSEIVSTGQIMVFVGEQMVLTVRRGEHTPLRHLRAELEANPELLARGPSYVLYRIFDTVVDEYQRVVAQIERDVDSVEELVFSRQGAHEVDRVYQLKRELIDFRRSVVPLAAPLNALATREFTAVPQHDRDYFREVADHHTEIRESVASFDDVLSTLLQASLARASVADNQDMRKISAAVAILAIPTTIGAIYGMNFDNMPELRTQNGYFVVLAVMLVSMVVAYLFFRRNRWL